MTPRDYPPIRFAEEPATTANVESGTPAPICTPETLVAAFAKAWATPVPFGTLYGLLVYLDRSLEPHVIELRDPLTNTVQLRFRADHPYLVGTKLDRATQGMGEGET